MPKIPSKLTPILLVLIVTCLVVFIVTIRGSAHNFPFLPNGNYEGSVSGITGSENESATLFVQREPGSQSLLFTIFVTGFQPQIVEMRQHASRALRPDLPLDPILLKNGNRQYLLTGSEKAGVFSGSVISTDNVKGSWELRATRQRVPSEIELTTEETTEVANWMKAKAKYRSLQREFQTLESVSQDHNKKLDQLLEYLGREDQLRQRGEERYQALVSEVKLAKAERAKLTVELNGLVNELGVIGRISSHGQAVDLARRVAGRENKWYLANWRAEEDRTGLEEFLGGSVSIDLRKLDSAYAKANEVKALMREAEESKAKIIELEARLHGYDDAPLERRGSEMSPSPPNAPSNIEHDQGDRRSLWDNILP